jgi:predicted protein tyrosine phosphatase
LIPFPPPVSLVLDLTGEFFFKQATSEWQARQAREAELAKFDVECSLVAPGVYVSAARIAHDRQALSLHGITHVVNCVGQTLPNSFESELEYLTLYLNDAQTENIACVFYEFLGAYFRFWFCFVVRFHFHSFSSSRSDFVLRARHAGGHVLVHCSHGISRSASLALVYIVHTLSLKYDEAFAVLQRARPVCKPNIGFMWQLQEWVERMCPCPSLSPQPHHSRVTGLARLRTGHAGSDDARLYRITRQSWQHPSSRLVGKSISDRSGRPLVAASALDPRLVFVLQPPAPRATWLWVGDQASPAHVNGGRLLVWRLQRYECAPRVCHTVYHGREPAEFWAAMGSDGSSAAAVGPREEYSLETKEETQSATWRPHHAMLFRGPSWTRVLPFSVDDFAPDAVLALVTAASMQAVTPSTELLLWLGAAASLGDETVSVFATRAGSECKAAVGLRSDMPVHVMPMSSSSARIWNYVPRS